MEKKPKGRPPKSEKIVRRSHFSIWATKEEKELLNQHIERSGLSASQYFLTLALNSPIKRPQKKSLPERTAQTILILEKLAGILSLAVLKTRDADMLSQRWQDSSKNVRMLSDLVHCYLPVTLILNQVETPTYHQVLIDHKKSQDSQQSLTSALH